MPQAGGAEARDVTVVGAGIVGVATALYLQRDGHRVRLVDPRAPGSGASYGNAGVVAVGACTPLGTPDILRRVPRMLLDRHGPLILRWRHLPRFAPWLIAFLWASRPRRVGDIAEALAALVTRADAAWRDLTRQCGAEALLRPHGWLKVYETDEAFARTRIDRDLMARFGLGFQVLSADDLRQLEPALAPIFRHGLLQTGSSFVSDPGRMVAMLAADFAARGGEIVKAEVTGFDLADPRRRVLTGTGALDTEVIVLAAGAWSRGLARRLGARVRLDTERGYHLMLPPAEPGLRHPTLWGDHMFALSPMEEGIRLVGGSEFAGLDAAPDFTRIRRLLPLAKRMLPSLVVEERSAWLGFRPSLPDSLPVIGRVPRQNDAYLAFGHGHLGLTLGPVTGRIVADLVAGRDPGLDLAPFRPRR